MKYEYLLAINCKVESRNDYNNIRRIIFTSSTPLDSGEAIDSAEDQIAKISKIDDKYLHILSFQLLRIIPEEKPEPSEINLTDAL